MLVTGVMVGAGLSVTGLYSWWLGGRNTPGWSWIAVAE